MESARCKAFVTAAETGSFSKAGEVLGYTPSGVSQLVTSLERELGLPLLGRNRKGSPSRRTAAACCRRCGSFSSRRTGSISWPGR